MTFLRSLFAICATAVILFSCKKELSDEDGKLPDVTEAGWEFTEAGKVSSGSVDTGFVQSIATVSTLSIVGTTSDESQGEIFLQVVGENITTGTYTNPLVFFQYSEEGNVIFQSSPAESGGFTVVITEMDSVSVSGTFSGTVKDASGIEHTITDGKFKATITFSVDEPDSLESGQLTVWAKQICSDGSSIRINVGGQTAEILDVIDVEPLCEAPGTAVFTLAAGTYTLEAICGSDTVRYEVAINDQCTVLEIDMQNPPEGDYLPLIDGSYWDYADMNDAATTQRITADGTEVFEEAKMYTRMVSSIGDTFYYRKTQNTYFEYRTLQFQEYVTDPPSIEMVILHDDYAAGESWESASELIYLSGLPATIKFRSTILRRDFAATYNGVEYTDLIEVNTEILFSSDGGATFTPGNSYNTVFAKGKGIVYYYDLDREVEWAVSGVHLNQ